MKSKTLLLVGLALVAVGCGSSEKEYKPEPKKTSAVTEVPAGEDKTLFPISVGNQWTYNSVSESVVDGKPRRVEMNITMEIKKVEPEGTGQKVTVEMREEDVVKSTQIWKVDDTGVYQVSVATETTSASFNPPQLLLKFPVKVDEEWTYNGSGPTALGLKSSIKAKSKNKGPQITDTYAGEVSAYSIETTSQLTGTGTTQDGKSVPLAGSMQAVAFYAPKMGMVRLQQTVAGRTGGETVTLQLMQSNVK